MIYTSVGVGLLRDDLCHKYCLRLSGCCCWWRDRGCERSDITKHVLVHNQPQHTCDICGKSFRHIKNKDLHLKRSAGYCVAARNIAFLHFLSYYFC